jgi:hypothetical protein
MGERREGNKGTQELKNVKERDEGRKEGRKEGRNRGLR